MHLHDAVDTVQDLVDLGLDTMTSKVVFKRIALWKQKGLPVDFKPTLYPIPTSHSPSHTAVVEDSALTPGVSGPSEKELDDYFLSALIRDREATGRIFTAGEAGNHLAEAYLSILYDRDDTLVGKDSTRASAYAEKALPWLRHHADSGNKYAQYNMASC